MKINELPWLFFIFIKILNSLCKVLIILYHINWNREGINQNNIGINKNPNIVLSQFKGKYKVVIGSNTENKLVIIFS